MLKDALTVWLPRLATTPDRKDPYHDLMVALAGKLQHSHKDRWLSDAWSRSAPHQAGFVYLGDAIKANLAGDPKNALKQAKRAARAFAGLNAAARFRAEIEEVYALHRMQRGDLCWQKANGLAKSLRGHSYVWVEAQTKLEQSVCATMLEAFGTANTLLEEGLALARAGNYPILELRAMGLKAALENARGNDLQALADDRSGLERYWAGHYPLDRAYQFYSDLSFIAQDYHEWRFATASAEEAESFVAQMPNKSLYAMAAYRTGYLAAKAGDRSEALRAYQLADQLFAELPQDEATRGYRVEGEVSLEALNPSQEGLNTALARLDGLSEQVKSIKRSSLLLAYHKARGNLQLLRGDYDNATKSFLAAIALGEKGLDSLKSASDRRAWEQEVGDAYRGMVEILFCHKGNPVLALRLWEWYKIRFQLHEGVETPAAAIDSAMKGDGDTLPIVDLPSPDKPQRDAAPGVVVYAQLADGVAIWLLKNGTVVSHWTSVPEQYLNEVAKAFAEECANPDSREESLNRDGYQLYRWLIEPISADVGQGLPLWIEPDRIISTIPMPALTTGNGRHLIEDHPIAVSLGLIHPTDPRFAVGQMRALVVGKPALGRMWRGAFPPLLDALDEARDVAATFPRSVIFESSAATPEAVRKELPRANLFHFAGHAVAGASMSGLLMAGDGSSAILSTQQVENLPLGRCQLAVLSACSTGYGFQQRAEDPADIASAFLHAGVSEVVATRWSVESSATRELMQTFYEKLRQGVSVPLALHYAMTALRASTLRKHPYYWAAYVAYVRKSPWSIPRQNRER